MVKNKTCSESHFFKEKSTQVNQKKTHDFEFFEDKPIILFNVNVYMEKFKNNTSYKFSLYLGVPLLKYCEIKSLKLCFLSSIPFI